MMTFLDQSHPSTSLKDEAKLLDSQRESWLYPSAKMNGHSLQDLHDAGYCDLALWSNPAWLDSNRCSIPRTAVTQWVVHHRTWMASSRETVAQIVGGVRGVISNSRLAKYGDYRYEINFEDMFVTPDDEDDEYKPIEMKRKNKSGKRDFHRPKTFDADTEDLHLDSILYRAYLRKNTCNLPINKLLNEWLKKVKDLLTAVQRIANHDLCLDSWTHALIKICLRFLSAVRINPALLKLMDSDIAFIVDYGQLQKEQVSKLELHSIPQPCIEDPSNSDFKKIEIYWLKLSSPHIRRFWTEDFRATYRHNVENQLYPLAWNNFLRRCKPKTCLDSTTRSIEIPNEVATELLGSLLETIEGSPEEASPVSISTASHHSSALGNSFPEAHGEWTKNLFPHRAESNPLRDNALSRTTNAVPPIPKSDFAKSDPTVSKNTAPPMRPYYMSVPPPSLANAMHHMSQVRPQFVYCQPQNDVTMMPSSSGPMNVYQHVPFKVPNAPISYMPPLYISRAAPPPNWNYMTQRISVPPQVTATFQYPRLSAPRMIYQPGYFKNAIENKRHPLNTDAPDLSSEGSLQQTDEQNTGNVKHMPGSIESKSTQGSSSGMDKPSIQQNYSEAAIPTRIPQNIANTMRAGNALPPLQYVPQNIYSVQPNPQVRTFKMPGRAGLFLNYKLPHPVHQPTHVPKNTTFTNILQPRFMGGVTVNDIKQMNQRLLMEKYRYVENGIDYSAASFENLPSSRDVCLNYEDKVEKWLETVNRYSQSGSNSNSERLAQPSSIPENFECEQLNKTNKFDCGEKGDVSSSHPTSMIRQRSRFNDKAKTLLKELNNLNENLIGNDGRCSVMSRKKKNRINHTKKHIFLFQSSLVKLKKGNYLEDEIKFLINYFAGIKLKKSKRCRDKDARGKITRKNRYATGMSKNGPLKQRPWTNSDTKSCSQRSSEYFNKIEDSFASMYSYRTLTRDSYEFNGFPSKRIKLVNALDTYSDKDVWMPNELNSRISSINYFNQVADDLLFSKENQNWCRSSRSEEPTNGWTHFRLAVKTILRNISNSLDNQNTQNVQWKSIKV